MLRFHFGRLERSTMEAIYLFLLPRSQITQPQWGLKSWTRPVWGRQNVITTQPAALQWNVTSTLNDSRTAFSSISFDSLS